MQSDNSDTIREIKKELIKKRVVLIGKNIFAFSLAGLMITKTTEKINMYEYKTTIPFYKNTEHINGYVVKNFNTLGETKEEILKFEDDYNDIKEIVKYYGKIYYNEQTGFNEQEINIMYIENYDEKIFQEAILSNDITKIYSYCSDIEINIHQFREFNLNNENYFEVTIKYFDETISQNVYSSNALNVIISIIYVLVISSVIGITKEIDKHFINYKEEIKILKKCLEIQKNEKKRLKK